ncbi:hypothetical protein J3459_016923 [Metarhizium acridum]|nr:hypothetical protein J3459_016923 [Metarhizium acridum]
MSDSNNPSGRSSSLQRMLDLEKQYMFDRLHPHSQPSAPSNAISQPATTTVIKNASPTRPGILTRRTEGNAQRNRPKSNMPPREPSLPPQLPPLVINTGAPITMSRSDLLAGQGRDYSPRDEDSTIVPTPSDKYPKVVSFEFPPTESAPAPCHSPSWEAYERRKTEKKTERREREESRNVKTRKLVKQPPAHSLCSMQHASASDVDANRGRRRERADSSTAVNNAGRPPRKARSRSGSFVSLLRAPFEFRRSSVDHGADSSFIGGIKLEMQRNATTQQALDHQAVEDESNIHPALRKGKQTDRWSAPLKSPPPPHRAGADGGNQRRYPPITRGKTTYHHKTMSLVSPTAPAVPDLNTIDKWRAKVGLKTLSRPGSSMGLDNDAHLNGTGAVAADLKQTTSEPRDALLFDPTRPTSASPQKPMHVVFPASPPPREKMLEKKPKLDHSNNVSISSCSTGDTFDTAPSSPPSEPPRRSSKRNSTLSLDGSIPPLPSPKHSSSSQPSPVQDSPPRRSFPLRGDEFHFKDTAKDHAIEAPVSISQSATYIPSPGFHLLGSSSEDSGSEDFHSTSILSTPATSRPQSEKSMPLEPSKNEPLELERSKEKSLPAPPTTTYPLHSTDNSEDEMDHIQAVAEKVLDVYNDIAVQPPRLRRRSNSQSTLTTDASIPLPLKERPLRLQSKCNQPGSPSQNAASPATYLEEARRQPLTVPTQRAHKQRLGPPVSFVLPDSDSDSAAIEKNPPSVPDIVGRSLRHKSTPLLSTLDREPVAKVFVECCNCKYYHDMPSNLYEAMANPESVLSPVDKYGYASALSTAVKCSWCRHEMSTRCCAGLAATVYIKERLH